ncbi:MAG: hypothetical protein V7749_17110 [Cocleimonas sp.]
MKTLGIIIFCIFSLVGSIGLSYALYPHAISPKVAESKSPLAMEDFVDDIDLGEDLGPMSVIDLMGYYLENPPEPDNSSVPAIPKRQFGGC